MNESEKAFDKYMNRKKLLLDNKIVGVNAQGDQV